MPQAKEEHIGFADLIGKSQIAISEQVSVYAETISPTCVVLITLVISTSGWFIKILISSPAVYPVPPAIVAFIFPIVLIVGGCSPRHVSNNIS